MKKLLSLLLALSLMLSLVCIPASANEEPDQSEYTSILYSGGAVGTPLKKYTPMEYRSGLSIPGVAAVIEGEITMYNVALRTDAHMFSEDGIDLCADPELYDSGYTVSDGRITYRYTLKEGKSADGQDTGSYITGGVGLFNIAFEPVADGECRIESKVLYVRTTDGVELYKDGEKTLEMQYGYQALTFPGISPEQDYPYGDADQDHEVTILDATRIQRFLAGLADMTTGVRRLADADRDGQVTILDATRIQRYLVGLSELA